MILTIAAVGSVGCGSTEAGADTELLSDGTIALSHAGMVTDSLIGRLILATPTIGDPRFMALSGQTLWIADRSGDPYLHIIDLVSDTVLESRGYGGEGPGDYGEVPQLSSRPGDSGAVWAYDARLRRLTREPADRRSGYWSIRVFEDIGQSAYSLQWQGADRLIGIGDMDTNRILVVDSTGELVDLIPNRLLGPDSASTQARRAISSGHAFCLQPDGGALAVLYLAAGQVDLYARTGEHLRRADVPFTSDGDWGLNRQGTLWFRVEWNYYLGCSATERFVYGLFAGQRTDGPAGVFARRALHVHVFDWTGARRAIWALDRPASTIVVSGDSVLFATGQDGIGLYRYSLPELE